MITTFEQRHAPGGRLCPAFDGSSSASSSSTTNNTDSRVVGGAQSVNVSANNSDNLHIIATDHGAVSAGMQLGTAAIAAATTSTKNALSTSADMYQGALGAVSSANEKLALAYQSGQAGDQTSLKYVGFIVVGLAAVTLFGKK